MVYNILMNKSCQTCGATFDVALCLEEYGRGKFCSKSCYYNFHPRVTKKCVQCGTDFWVHNHRKRDAKFCSRDCAYMSRRGVARSRVGISCRFCHNTFQVPPFLQNRRQFCTRKCYWGFKQTQTGEKSHQWRGGLTPIHELIRAGAVYAEWRMGVFRKDGYVCQGQGCGTHKNLQADHIKPFAVILRENGIDSLEKAMKCFELWDVKNGRTLCKDCHKRTDTFAHGTIKMLAGLNL